MEEDADMYKNYRDLDWKPVKPFKQSFYGSLGPHIRITTTIESSVCPPTGREIKERIEKLKSKMKEWEEESPDLIPNPFYISMEREIYALETMLKQGEEEE